MLSGLSRIEQRVTAGKLISEIIAHLSDGFQGHVARLPQEPLLFCSNSNAPTILTMASSLGKMPTTSVVA